MTLPSREISPTVREGRRQGRRRLRDPYPGLSLRQDCLLEQPCGIKSEEKIHLEMWRRGDAICIPAPGVVNGDREIFSGRQRQALREPPSPALGSQYRCSGGSLFFWITLLAVL